MNNSYEDVYAINTITFIPIATPNQIEHIKQLTQFNVFDKSIAFFYKNMYKELFEKINCPIDFLNAVSLSWNEKLTITQSLHFVNSLYQILIT